MGAERAKRLWVPPQQIAQDVCHRPTTLGIEATELLPCKSINPDLGENPSAFGFINFECLKNSRNGLRRRRTGLAAFEASKTAGVQSGFQRDEFLRDVHASTDETNTLAGRRRNRCIHALECAPEDNSLQDATY